jgi:hypothetical protein
MRNKETVMLTKTPNGYKVASPGVLLILVCFFLPWVLQSCGGAPPQESSGWQLAIGNAAPGERYNGNLLIFLVPLAALVVAALAFRAMRRAYASGWDGYVPTGLGGLMLLFLYLQFGGPVSEGSTRQILYGLWGVVIGWMLVIAGGILNLFDARKPPGKV